MTQTMLLVCSAGMSTHLLLCRMQAAAPANVLVGATAAATALSVAADRQPSVVMLAPQVGYLADKLRQQLTAPVVVLNGDAFLQMDGAALMHQALPYL